MSCPRRWSLESSSTINVYADSIDRCYDDITEFYQKERLHCGRLAQLCTVYGRGMTLIGQQICDKEKKKEKDMNVWVRSK